jgi:hypothetical protein
MQGRAWQRSFAQGQRPIHTQAEKKKNNKKFLSEKKKKKKENRNLSDREFTPWFAIFVYSIL